MFNDFYVFHLTLRLHDASIIHGDLTTSNMVMVASETTSPEPSSAVLNSSLCDGAGEKETLSFIPATYH